MPSPRDLTSTTWRVPRAIKAAAEACARSAGQSLSAFVTQAVAQRIRNWEDPVTGKRVIAQEKERAEVAPYAGWFCNHAGHGGEVDAAACIKSGPHYRHHQANWYRSDDVLATWEGDS